MRSAVLICPFDPVTEEELAYAKSLRKSKGYRDIYLVPAREGVLSCSARQKLLEKATAPFRHIHAETAPNDAVKEDIGDLVQGEAAVRSGIFRLAAAGIRNLLLQKGFYMDEIVKAMCKPNRAKHSLGVAETACMLAKVHGMDDEKARVMGMLHDITKRMPDEEGRRVIHRWKPEWDRVSPKVWHSFTAVIFLKQEMYCHDRDLLHAIEHHTIGDGKRDYDHILYIADKIEPGRNYDTSRQTALSKQNLKAGAHCILEESRKYIFEKEGIHV